MNEKASSPLPPGYVALPVAGPEPERWVLQFLRAWRRHRGLSQEDLALRAGVSLSLVRRAERGGLVEADTDAAALARAFDLPDATWLVLDAPPEGEAEPPPKPGPKSGNARLAALRARREQRGLTQSGLAQAAGVSLSTVCRLEAGQPTTRATAQKLAAALGIAAAELTGEKNP